MNTNPSASNSFLPWGLSWLTVLLAVLTLGTFIAVSGPVGQYPIMMNGVGGGYAETSVAVPPMAGGAPTRDIGVSMPYPYPYPNPEVPVTDIREYLKINYNASLRARDVPKLTRRVETTVRGHAGRVDQVSSARQYGYVSFALPQSRYEAFRTEIESMVGSRFLEVNISSQNLLAQKVSIEEQQKQADANLTDYKTARQRIVVAHTAAVQSLQAKIDADNAQLSVLRAQPSTPQLLIQIQAVTDDVASLKKQLTNENASYTTQLSNADSNIKYAEDWQKAVQTQDKTLLENVATVSGTISIQWISYWDIALAYLPGYWIPGIFAVLTVLSFFRDRRRLLTRVV